MQHLVCFDIFKQGSKQSLSNFSPSWIRTWILGTNIVQAETLCLFLNNSCLCDNWIRIGLTKIMSSAVRKSETFFIQTDTNSINTKEHLQLECLTAR